MEVILKNIAEDGRDQSRNSSARANQTTKTTVRTADVLAKAQIQDLQNTSLQRYS